MNLRKYRKPTSFFMHEVYKPYRQKKESGIYILCVVRDSPYHEGLDLWFRPTIEEILDVADSEWSWMEEYETYLYRVKFGEFEYDNISYLLPPRKKITKKELAKYKPFREDDYEDIFACTRCFYFNNTSGKCQKCKKQLTIQD